MRATAILSLLLALVSAQPAAARTIVEASDPTDLSVTIYRDPDRSVGEEMNRDWPQGFAMISEVRTVSLPAGVSTIRFIGVAEGMVGVSAIVTGLPGGTIEKNRNAELLSPAALVNGALGNRITITRTNPATGEAQSEQAIVRTRADGGLVLQTSQGYEAVRCAGLPEKLTFDRIPDGLSAKPVYTIDTQTPEGGTYEITLTYLAWGFDWQADYVATIHPAQERSKGRGDEFTLQLLSWLTLLNDNDQSFDNARLQIIAGTLNIETDFEGLSDPPVARPLRLTCYPFGSTAAGSPIAYPPPPSPSPSAPMGAVADEMITVTGARMRAELMESAAPVSVVTAEEENLGDLKLFRVPDRVDVSAKGMKQVAFLNQDEVKARFLYTAECDPYGWFGSGVDPQPAGLLLATRNDEEKGLGLALPQGAMKLFEPSTFGPQLAATTELRDYARGQDVELEIGESAQVFARCARLVEAEFDPDSRKWTKMQATITNANPHPVTMRLKLGWAGDWDVRFPREKVFVKDGYDVVEVRIAANSSREFNWRLRNTDAD
ncbi:DUF4139 domain-containing protein [Erythrobacter sp. JK5]|uniref:DUF4139 domain-containing protein n=1 Tax=Erythrobacter sp. JK5 TaxID=2829500 RepID=UPI001BA62B8D|nr:hypothetical protein [Erythrobacter sp. JK5]QUL38452.1 hypothetical protein KDC96_03325 [Erythrobacter sp. JK5]